MGQKGGRGLRLFIGIKLMVLLAAAILIAVVTVGLLSVRSAENALQERILHGLQNIATARERGITSLVEQDFERVALIASRTRMRECLSRIEQGDPQSHQLAAKMNQILDDVLGSLDALQEVSATDADGKIIASTNRGLIGKQMADSQLFRKGKEGFSLGNLQYQGGRLTYDLAAPLLHPEMETFIGVTVVRFVLLRMSQVLSDYTGLGDTGELVLGRKDEDRIELVGPLRYATIDSPRRSIPLDASLFEPLHRAMAREEGITVDRDYRHVKVLAAYRYISIGDWGLVVKIDAQEAFQPIDALRTRMALLGSLLAILGVACAYLVFRRVSKPIRELQTGVEKIANGQLDYRIEARGRDELGRLGRAFNLMAHRLETDRAERQRAKEALRASEERYRRLVETASEGIWQIDTEFRTTDVNERMAQMLGRPKAEIIGRYIREFMAPEEMADVEQRLENRRRGVREIYERRILRKDGSTLPTLISVTPLRDNSGNVIGSFGTFTDISARKQAEDELRHLNETLEQQVAERTALAEARARQLQALAVELIEAEEGERQRVAELLHDDLQQILAAARLQLEAACESLPPEPLLANVERLLAVSIGKARHLSHELSPAVSLVSDLITALKWLARQMGDQFGLHVHLEPDGDQQVESPSVKVFLFRAAQELLFNVVKHAGVKSARLVLSGSDECLGITVSDQGRGFNPDILNSADVKAGLGLLSLRERARYIGGDLLIESAPGQGSRFTLTVPLSLSKADKPQQLELAVDPEDLIQAGSASIPRAEGIKVLCSDDHHVMRQGLVKLLAGQPGLRVIGEASNGREAIDLVRQLKPDVVVMDVSMPEMDALEPEMDGIETTRRIKSELPGVRVIGLSMHEDEQIARSMHEAGAEAFVSKSAPAAELLKAIYGVDRKQPHRPFSLAEIRN